MDILDVFTSSDEEQRQTIYSEGSPDGISTDVQKSVHTHKTKNIKKKYEPIEEDGVVYHYDKDPSEYKRIRKKVQNRLSARRVRGKKEKAFDSLEHEVEHLRKVNSEVQLANARLQTENKSLKEQLEFVKSLLREKSSSNLKPEPIEKFLSPDTLSESPECTSNSNEFESPFMEEEESDWLRLPNRRTSSRDSWVMLGVFTLVLAVFVVPSSDSPASTPSVLYSVSDGPTAQATDAPSTWDMASGLIVWCSTLAKSCLRYALIGIYISLLYLTSRQYYRKSKLKKV